MPSSEQRPEMTSSSSSSSHTLAAPQTPRLKDDRDMSLRKRPWRRNVTPWEHIVNHVYEGEGTEEKPYIVDWLPEGGKLQGKAAVEGKKPPREISGDPENPMTWSQVYKWSVTASVAIATLAVAFASSALSGAEASIETRFAGYPAQVYVMVTSAFVLGFVVGPLLWAPLSEVLGRRLLFIGTYILFTAFNGGVVASQNIWTLVVLRFFAGTAGSSPLTNAGGTVADIFDAGQRGLGMALFAAAPFLGPALGPIVGGFAGEAIGWRWVAGIIAIFTGVLTVMGTLVIPETYAPKLLRDRANKLSKVTGHVYRSKYEKEKKVEIKQLFKTALGRPWVFLLKEPIVILLTFYLAIIYGTLYILFGAFPIIFEMQRHWSPGISGLAFIGPLIGFMMAIAYTVLVENKRYAAKLEAEGWLAPEQRLLPAILGSVLLPIGLFATAWTAAPARIHWIAPIICSVPFGMGMVLVFLSCFNYLIDSYLLYAASVLAANSVLRSLFGVGLPLAVPNLFAAWGINWSLSFIGFLALACMPLPLLFYLYGPKIRLMSKYGRHADQVGQMMRKAALAKKHGGDPDSAEKGQHSSDNEERRQGRQEERRSADAHGSDNVRVGRSDSHDEQA